MSEISKCDNLVSEESTLPTLERVDRAIGAVQARLEYLQQIRRILIHNPEATDCRTKKESTK